jgi:hypothetical protein
MISEDALKQDNKTWERLGPIASGGTVFGLAISPVADVPRIWAATGCGIFVSDDSGGSWTQSLTGLTTPLLSTVAVAANGALFAGALGGDLFASFDWGKSFQGSIVPVELKATVTAIVPSPNFRNDGTVFAATDGGGLLVSRNSAKSWEDSSFGLGGGNVLALASSPDWSQRQILFAATMEGVYISNNGGRAWRETDLLSDEEVIDVLAVSPAFEHDRTIYAGTEGGKLYSSKNGGRTWDLLQEAVGPGPLNGLWLAPDFSESGYMVAAVASRIYVSTDRGETWQVAADLPGPALAMSGNDSMLLVGLHDAGIWCSTDRGQTWLSSSAQLAARGFARLVVAEPRSEQAPTIYAIGPQEGLWASSDSGKVWRNYSDLAAYFPLTAVALDQAGHLCVASQQSGILRLAAEGESWEVVLPVAGVQAVALAPSGGDGWAGTSEGKLYSTIDGGVTWQEAASPCEGEEILLMAVSPTYEQDHTLLMGTAVGATTMRQARVALWRSTNGGANWRQVTTQVTDARWIDIAMPSGITEHAVDQAVLATGWYCLRPLRRAKDVWISTRVDPQGANTLSVIALGEIDRGGTLYAATGTGIYRSIDGGRTWQPFMAGMSTESFISIVAAREGEQYVLYALSLGGSIWRRDLA